MNASGINMFQEEAKKCFGGLSCTIDTKHMELLIHTPNSMLDGHGYTLPFRGWIHDKSLFSVCRLPAHEKSLFSLSFEQFVDDDVPVPRIAPRTTLEIMNDASLLLHNLNHAFCVGC